MTVISEYDGFTIYFERGKLFVAADSTPPREVKEVFRVKYPESEQYSDTEILDLCPEEYDYSGEPINECDYVFWKCVDDEPDSLKVSPELDARYKDACELCCEKHLKIYGEYPINCAFCEFNNEYCPDIAIAERQRLAKETLSPVMSAYLQALEKNDNMAYSFILSHALDFSRAELIAIIRAFDYVISPYLTRSIANFGNLQATDAYKAVSNCARAELRYSASEGDDAGMSIEERIKQMKMTRNKTGV